MNVSHRRYIVKRHCCCQDEIERRQISDLFPLQNDFTQLNVLIPYSNLIQKIQKKSRSVEKYTEKSFSSQHSEYSNKEYQHVVNCWKIFLYTLVLLSGFSSPLHIHTHILWFFFLFKSRIELIFLLFHGSWISLQQILLRFHSYGLFVMKETKRTFVNGLGWMEGKGVEETAAINLCIFSIVLPWESCMCTH